jgi:hypothetical protein
MLPPSTLLTAYTGLKTASDLARRVREALGSREVKIDEVIARIIEVQGLINDGRTTLIDVEEQPLEKNRTIGDRICEPERQERLSKKQQGRI